MLFRGCSREHGIFHRWADPHSRVPLVERGGVAREGAEALGHGRTTYSRPTEFTPKCPRREDG